MGKGSGRQKSSQRQSAQCLRDIAKAATELADKISKLEKRNEQLEAEREKIRELLDLDELVRRMQEEDGDHFGHDYYFDEFNTDDWIACFIGELVRKATEVPGELQRELFKVVHEGGKKYRDRLKWCSHEKTFAEQWKEYNKRHDVLENITGMHVISQRDASMCADVIQWLGTACGDSFLRSCLRITDKISTMSRRLEFQYTDDQEREAKLIAEGVLQKMAVSRMLSDSKLTFAQAERQVREKLLSMACRRVFDVQ